jgi:hypothetical protein
MTFVEEHRLSASRTEKRVADDALGGTPETHEVAKLTAEVG